jgi:hypothetical protein
MATAGFTHEKIVRHTHTYNLATSRPAEVMATAEKEAESFLSNGGANKAASDYSDTVTRVGINKAGGTYAYWIQAGDEKDAPCASSADSVTTSFINLYLVKSESASGTNVRAALDAAERDAKKYAKDNDLEFSKDIVTVFSYEDNLVVCWSTEADDE